MLKTLLSLFSAYDSESDVTEILGAAGVTHSGPMVNVDGTPMMDGGMVDVMGKSYGDSGHRFDSDFGGHDNFGFASFSDDSCASNSFGSDW